MKAVKEYFILEAGSADKLEELVNAAIKKENKQPFGFPIVVSAGEAVGYIQAMAYYGDTDTDWEKL